ncbi:MAG: hypothetical protein HYX57_07935 [Chloroflexi bacterium]|nr:hypothetical protein [Chloroflexota bacterium]
MTDPVAHDRIDLPAMRELLERVRTAVKPVSELPGWATVELDRAARELGAPDGGTELPADPMIGALVRRLAFTDRQPVLVLEPSTEGPLAAALARHGEGLLARYLLVAADPGDALRRAGIPVTAPAAGPLGTQRLVVPTRRDGPFIVIVGPPDPP